jgi:hypothetical protein
MPRLLTGSSCRLSAALALLVGCSDSGGFQPNYHPASPVFSNPTALTNPYLPYATLIRDTLQGTEAGQSVLIQRTRMTGTKTFTINGQTIQAMILEDRDSVNGVLEEVTLDYLAQSDDGTVYYLGEDVDVYQGGQIVSHEGGWLLGVNTSVAGILMPGQPAVGQKFRGEDVPGLTREDDEVLSIGETVAVPAGTFTGCVKIRETLSDGSVEYKYYAPNVGVVREAPAGGGLDLTAHH